MACSRTDFFTLLPNNTVSKRIDEIADDFREQLIQKTKESDFIATEFDESTDVSNLAQFSCFVRYISDGFMKQNVLLCKPIPGQATGQCLFHLFHDTSDGTKVMVQR
jgi:hypothetical protein